MNYNRVILRPAAFWKRSPFNRPAYSWEQPPFSASQHTTRVKTRIGNGPSPTRRYLHTKQPDPDINASFWAAEVLTVVVTIGYWLSCREKVPICDRRRYNSSLFPGKHIEQGLRAERRLAEAAKEGQDEASRVILPDSHPFVQAVLSVVPRLSAAAETDPVNWDIEVVDALSTLLSESDYSGGPRYFGYTFLTDLHSI